MDIILTNGPSPFEFETDGASSAIDWKNWIRGFEIYIRVNKIVDDQDKLDWLLHFTGPKVQNVYFNLPEEENESDEDEDQYPEGFPPIEREYEKALCKLESFFAPKLNPSYERHVFRKIKQGEKERIDMFVLRLRTQAEKCNFDNQLEESIKDQVIVGCHSRFLQRKILERGDKNLDDVLKMARILESVAEQQKSFDVSPKETPQTELPEVCKIETKAKSKTFVNRSSGAECSRCGYRGHKASDGNCPAMGKTCNKCSGRNHFARKCLSRENKRKFGNAKENQFDNSKFKKPKFENEHVQMIGQSNHGVNEEEYDDVFYFESDEAQNQLWCKVGGIDTKVVVDSGSKHNIVDRETWMELKEKGIQTTQRQKDVDRNFNAYGGHRLKFLGMFGTAIETPTRSANATFYVADEFGKFLVGMDTARALGVIKIGYNVNNIQTESSEFNKIKGFLIDIPIRPEVKPVSQPYRRVGAENNNN